MDDEEIITKLLGFQKTIDEMIKSINNQEYFSPEGAMYCIFADGNEIIRALKAKQPDL